MRLNHGTLPASFNAHPLLIALGYLGGYVLLDRISFIEPYGPFGAITPWNPNTGLSFVLFFLFGQRFLPLLFISPLLADLANRPVLLPWMIELLSAVLIGGGYSAALIFLKRPKIGFDPALSSTRDVVLLILVTVISAAVVSSAYVGLLISARLLSLGDFAPATLRYWIGDVIGILGLTPFALFALTRRRILPLSAETALQFIAILAALFLVFGSAKEQEFQLFYVLFLPIFWMAVRTGIEGVSAGIVLVQLGVILGVHFFPQQREELTAFQAMMVVLTATGLIAGEAVSERRRAEVQLRLQQESLDRLARLGSVGELAAAVAHEVNQPLMAAGTYTRMVVEEISSQKVDTVAITDTARKALAQVDRAAEVIRRLRALVRLDRSNRAPCDLRRIAEETINLCQPDLDRMNVAVRFKLSDEIPPIMVDILQIQQVLLNLLRNSIEAIRESGNPEGSIQIEAQRANHHEFVELRIADSGPGFPRERGENPFLPLSSNKPGGLGIGLPLCRSIVEAHGGRLWVDTSSNGGLVCFTVPTAAMLEHA
jgi:two-component system sensor kinase FixL